MKAINLSGKTLLIALLLTMSACVEIDTFTSNTGDVVFKGFGIELFQTGGANDRVLAESTWKHVYKNTAKIEIENKVNGQKYTLDYNPNNFTQAYKITLPFGDYSFRSVVEGGEFEPFLPFEASGEFTLSSESMDITLQATTDYGLITVKNQFVTSAVVSTGENSPVNLALLGDDSFRFIYAKGSTPTKLEIIESYSGTTIERNLEIVKYRHYNFILELSEGNVNFIDLVVGAFEYEEEVISIGSNLQIGDSFQGGIIAYILQPGDPGYDANVTHGIIAAPSDLGRAAWYNGIYITTGATGTALGTGQSNTTAIVNAQGDGIYAASLCNDLVLGGYDDWYLPSLDELNKLYLSKDVIGNFVGNGASYWSSTEADYINGAWAQSFTYGTQFDDSKLFDYPYVRAVRSF
ncbi:DUF1566 domain-containing protein [Shivajiella indica]|uniref:DUF1566 domain-containing protein n=1 Tax=Shivajiella indica TaxID=872115 RepID=A0ABW5B2F6_9BACT